MFLPDKVGAKEHEGVGGSRYVALRATFTRRASSASWRGSWSG